jgi:hypothetical protein
MGMGIHLVRFSVCCPSGMCHADGSGGIFIHYIMFQLGDFSLAFKDVQFIIQDADASTVIPPVFEPVQTFDQDGIGFPWTDVSNNSTHIDDLRGSKVADSAGIFKSWCDRYCPDKKAITGG